MRPPGMFRGVGGFLRWAIPLVVLYAVVACVLWGAYLGGE